MRISRKKFRTFFEIIVSRPISLYSERNPSQIIYCKQSPPYARAFVRGYYLFREALFSEVEDEIMSADKHIS